MRLSSAPWRIHHGRSRGQAVIEFALVLPLLLAVIFGIVDFGRAYNYKNDTNHLANEAVRYAAVGACAPCTGGLEIPDVVRKDADSGELRDGTGSIAPPGVQVTLCFPSGTGVVGEKVRADVTATYNWLGIVNVSAISSTLHSSSTMRLEKSYDPATAPYTPLASCPS